jgi:flagellar biosynthetic protein FliP
MISVSGCQLTWILYAQPIPGEATGQGRWLVTLAAIFIVPALLAVMTAFARIVILLYFLRAGLGSQVLPPNLVVVGIAVVLTWFVMAPAAKEMQTSVLVPLWQGRMTADAAVSQMQKILRSFMVRHVGMEDYRILAQLRDVKEPPTTGPHRSAHSSVRAFRIAHRLLGRVANLPPLFGG